MMKQEKNFVVKGDICFSENPTQVTASEQSFAVCVEGVCQGVFREIPEQYQGLPVLDFGRSLILPGLTDLHIHAPQYGFRSLGMDLELLEWLNTRTFPEEEKYQDVEYARKGYGFFAEDLKYGATTRVCAFGTIHRASTEILMDLLEEAGLKAMVGKVNMDRNSSPNLTEAGAEASLKETECWLKEIKGRYENVRPILTPRFVPSCSDGLLKGLGELAAREGLPVQSHLSENQGEIRMVKELCPWSEFYGDVYDHFGLFGGENPAIMAHCVWSSEEEILRMKERGVFVAHCAQSNANLASGIAPVRRYMDLGLNVGLGTDVAGGVHTSIFRAMADAIMASKLRWRLVDESLKPLTVEEAFYLGTMGGGAFFGKVGTFKEGYEFDAVVMDDSTLKSPRTLTLPERLERLVYLSESCRTEAKFVAGRRLF